MVMGGQRLNWVRESYERLYGVIGGYGRAEVRWGYRKL